MLTLKRTIALVALLAPVSCGNCEDKRPGEKSQPGTPTNPVQGSPTARDFRFVPKVLQDAAPEPAGDH
jgi:hypothetical protein